MKFMLLIQHGETFDWEQLSAEEQQRVYAGYGEVNATPGVTPGERLADPENATTVRVQNGKTLTTDGPFVALKEALGGWLFYEADDLDAAIELAAKIPASWLGGSVEIRPFFQE